jgi:hypothetical protein
MATDRALAAVALRSQRNWNRSVVCWRSLIENDLRIADHSEIVAPTPRLWRFVGLLRGIGHV